MTASFKGKIALVTGASRGIGQAIAERLAEQGFDLVVTARSADKLDELVRQCQAHGVKCHALPLDLSEADSPSRLIGFVKERFGTLDVLVNNAANPGGGRLQNAELARWDRCLDLNFRSIVHLSSLALPLLQGKDWGAIINISSISGSRPAGGTAMYSATKHALNGFSHSIFEDIREQGIKVVLLCPGFVATDMVAKRDLVEEKMIQPRDLADAVSFALSCSGTVCPVEITLRPQRSPYRHKS